MVHMLARLYVITIEVWKRNFICANINGKSFRSAMVSEIRSKVQDHWFQDHELYRECVTSNEDKFEDTQSFVTIGRF